MLEIRNVGQRTFLISSGAFNPGQTIFISGGEYANLVSMFPSELLLMKKIVEEVLAKTEPLPPPKVPLFPPSKGQKKR